MAKFQLWSRDEYGQGSILTTSDDIDEIVKAAKKEITDINVNNALTADDKARNWEAYMVVIASGKKNSKTKYVYGGGDPRTKDMVYSFNANGEEKMVKIQDIPDAKVKIYLGDISTTRNKEEDWFAQDARRNIIESMDHQDLQGKTQFFVKKV